MDKINFYFLSKLLQEKYEKELKDAIARELMHAEEAALLNKVISDISYLLKFRYCLLQFSIEVRLLLKT